MTDAEIVLSEAAALTPQAVPFSTPFFDSPADYLEWRAQQLEEAHRRILKPDVHFGVIPGTNKPTLFKPGAEFLLKMFDLTFRTEIIQELSTVDIPGGFVNVVIRGAVYDSAGKLRDTAIASASSAESRWQRPSCPECGAGVWDNRAKKRQDSAPEWLKRSDDFTCRDKCGWSSNDDPPSGFSPDMVNTILKMATKRALVAVALTATGASAFFTQDMEEKTQSQRKKPSTPTVEVEVPDFDAGAWLKSHLAVFKDWTPAERRKKVTEIMAEQGWSNPLSKAQCDYIVKLLTDIYAGTPDDLDPERPF